MAQIQFTWNVTGPVAAGSIVNSQETVTAPTTIPAQDFAVNTIMAGPLLASFNALTDGTTTVQVPVNSAIPYGVGTIFSMGNTQHTIDPNTIVLEPPNGCLSVQLLTAPGSGDSFSFTVIGEQEQAKAPSTMVMFMA
jgi:hypothetical protein